MSTIAAISTPNAPGGIAVIRISGEQAIDVAERIFKPFGGKRVSDMAGYSCAYGAAYDGDERLDDCILTVFRAPHSYTGEDTAELSCHGGICITRQILRVILKNGAENAGPGEFTKRAFMNGKIDLTQAEAVMDIISAKGSRELKMAEQLRSGAVFKSMKRCSDKLIRILGSLAAWADYPEEDIPEVEPTALANSLREVYSDISSLIANYDRGRILRNGISAVIVGRPNVGKSTLFNCLSGCERSIVTDIAGTTRDMIEETVMLGDIALRLSDTAGIHNTNDVIEGIGVDIARKQINEADLVFAVFDGSCPLTADDLDIIKNVKNKNCIAIINKNDTEIIIDSEIISESFKHIVYLSAKNSDGLDKLKDAVEEEFRLNEMNFDTATAANERQKRCIECAMNSIMQAIDIIENGEMLDAVTVVIDEAEQHLLELTGEKITNAVVDEVFSRFCVGK